MQVSFYHEELQRAKGNSFLADGQAHYPMEDLQRAFQTNPARNMEVRLISRTGYKSLTPDHVRRSLSPNAQKGPLIDASFVSSRSPQCNARIASKDDKRDDE
ncbi:hypothetical protein PENANT_c085G08652 [Penicillium antarcticum]|uniref:Uncharacterized protein n=1 Tax=Penicillium antarcticum TaxID=416450 RepID=A0A1V6PP83_9EURO|nr:hypothetical protein PENANT_c085G08652 [Penicillium antarcticum]